MSAHAFGLWSGTAINDTSSVVAAAYAYGGDAGATGIVVKLTRTLMLIPIVIVLAILRARPTAGKETTSGGLRLHTMPWRKIVPMFLIGFIVASGLDSLGVIPSSWHPALSVFGTFLITTALVGIGLSLRPADMRQSGHRPLLLGALLWVAVAASSLGVQSLTGTI